MRTDQIRDLNHDVGTFGKRLAVRVLLDNKFYIFVFKDISPKRIGENEKKYGFSYDHITHKKVIFISNKELMNRQNKWYSYWFMVGARQLVFDGKFGTRYESRNMNGGGSSGPYFHCTRYETYSLKVDTRRSHK